MPTIARILLALCAAFAALPAAAQIKVFACEPEWAALAQELAGDRASVYAATTALQDPHRIEARPSLIARIRSADLVICAGADLEAGWLPLLLRQSGNARVQPGGPGYIEAAQYVTRLEIPRLLDRSQGDVHPGGNPHVHLDPRNIAKVADVLAERLAQIDAGGGTLYKTRAAAFRERWQAASARWAQQGARLRGTAAVVYHKNFTYLFDWLGMREAGSLEPRPGIPPTPAHLASLVEQMKREPAKMILYAPYNDARAAEFLSSRTGLAAVMLPFTVGGSGDAKDLYGLFDDTLARLLAVLK